jgi:hypothetical protein
MSKVESQHLQRRAYVYVRQSTMAQVERNVESRERQYELVDRAVELGWPAGEVVVVDEDQGRSGKSTAGRDGFQGLVVDVGLGRVGIVLGIDRGSPSRLHHLRALPSESGAAALQLACAPRRGRRRRARGPGNVAGADPPRTQL